MTETDEQAELRIWHANAIAAEEQEIAEHDAEIRNAALKEAAVALLGHIGIQSTNGVGWIPTDSLAGAARYLLHLARDEGNS